MERLTTRNIAGVAVYKHPFECERCGETIYRLPDYGSGSPTEKLAAYEDAEEQGLLLRLPYPLGTEHIYFIDKSDMEIYELDGRKIEVSLRDISEDVMYTIDCYDFLHEDFGEVVFLTREEAEAKLAEMEGAE